jgi:succinate dehydrogenase / fumarate reductase cytochrome b subunit
MKWSFFFTTAIGKKIVMALTGLFLITFLIVHVGLNACIFNDLSFFDPADNGEMFNKAAHFMGSTVVIRIIEIGLFLFLILHTYQGYQLTVQNRRRRGQGYAKAAWRARLQVVQPLHGFAGHHHPPFSDCAHQRFLVAVPCKP